ncbi:MAG: hypothetical protein U9P90_02725, partial [Patescibacteria group bacterium]|nr:hypothetical protein [Patescibacteria group bacterium]
MPEEVKKKQEKDDLDKFQALPQVVQDFISSPKSSKTNLDIFKKFKLSSEQESLYFDITDKVFYKELSLEDFPAEVEKAFGL